MKLKNEEAWLSRAGPFDNINAYDAETGRLCVYPIICQNQDQADAALERFKLHGKAGLVLRARS